MFRTFIGGLTGLALALAAAPAGAVPPAAPTSLLPSDADIAAILQTRVATERRAVGVVVGVIDANGRRVIAAGARDAGDPRPLTGDTEFEIGSVTKVFTSLLLADMVRRGQVALDDPAVKYLPPGATLPVRNGKAITLVDLATHTSGLPRMPTNFTPANSSDPYADYDDAKLYAFLSGYVLPRDIGATYEYSNLGAGLLGQLLARRAGTSYAALVQARVARPLGLKDTAIALSSQQTARLAVGHDASLAPVGYWTLDSLAGAGALHSTANDLLTLVAAELGYVDTPLKGAMADQLLPRRPAGGKLQVALGWHVSPGPEGGPAGEIVWHNGATGGFHSFVGFDKARGVGVVVLVNTASEVGGDDIAMHLLAGAPLSKPKPVRQAVPLAASVLERYVGQYQMAPGVVIAVTRQDARLFAQLTGQPAAEIFPESPTDFFWKVVDAQAHFEVAPDGKVASLTLHQGGRDLVGPRVP
jgi:D-alanyl-D-alanine-carboxypeptidase/D-alanyl-D-alanine-endopeptidase